MSGSGGDGHNSGSGGSSVGGGTPGAGGGSGAGGGGSSTDPCNIDEIAPINSPQPAVIRALSVGDRLDVQVTGAPRRILQLVAGAGVAGSLTHRGALNIVNCIDAGNGYEAEVITINGGQVTVRITRA